MTRGDYIEAAQMFRAAAKVAAAGGDAKAASLWWWAARQGIAYARRKTVSGKKKHDTAPVPAGVFFIDYSLHFHWIKFKATLN